MVAHAYNPNCLGNRDRRIKRFARPYLKEQGGWLISIISATKGGLGRRVTFTSDPRQKQNPIWKITEVKIKRLAEWLK
jgi:hypothetical protein